LKKKLNENKKEKKGNFKRKVKKKKRKALWITIVIHSVFGCEEQ